MPELLTGIELFEGVRLARLARTPASIQLAGTAGLDLPGEKDLSRLARAACRLIAESGLEADRYALVLPSDLAVLRNLEFPFSSIRKISQVYRLEMETKGAFLQDDAVFDFLAGPRGESRAQNVIAACLPKEPLAPCIEALREGNVAPRALDVDLGALNALIPHALGELSQRCLLFFVDESRTLAVMREQGRPALLRALPLGASRLREDPDGAGFALFKRELLSCLLAGGREKAGAPMPVATAGPCGGEEPVKRAIMRALRLSEPPYAPRSGFLAPGAADGLPGDFAIALGAAFRAANPADGMNFLKDEFAPVNPPSPAAGRRVLAGLAVFAVAAWIFSTVFDISLQRARLRSLDAQQMRIVKTAAGQVREGLTPEQYESILKTRLREAQGSEAGQKSGASLVSDLRQISMAVDPGLGAVIEYFGASESALRIRAKADAYEAVEKIKESLLRSGAFESVTIKEAKAQSQGQGVEFELDIVRK